MTYLIIQILTLLLAATILGLGIGWLIRAFSARRVENQLSDKINKSAQTVSPLKEALSRAQADTEDRDNIINNLRETLGERKEALNDAMMAQRAIEEQHGQIEKQMASATADLERANREKAAENEQYKDKLDDERNQYKQALEELQKKIDNDAKQNGSQEATVAALENSLAVEKAQHAEVAKKLALTEEKAAEKYANEKEKAQIKIETLKDKLDDERDRHKEAMAAEKKHAEKIEKELRAQNDKIANLEKAHSDGEAQIAAATRELNTQAQQKNDITSKERERSQYGIDAAKEKLDDERRQFSQALGELQKKIDHGEKENDSQKAAIAAFEKSLAAEKAQYAELVKQLAAAEQKAADNYANEKNNAQSKIDTLKDKLDDERDRHKEAMAAEKKHADKIEKELRAQNDKIANLEKAHSDGEAQIAAATRELNTQAQQKNDIASKERERAQHGIDAAKEKLDDERRQFSQALGDLQKKIDHGDKENGSQKVAVAALEKSIAEEKAKHAELVKQLAATEEKYANEKNNAQSKFDTLKDKLDDERGRHKEAMAAERKHADKIDKELKAQNDKIANLEKAHSDGEAQIAAATRELNTQAQQKNDIASKERERAQHGIDAAKEKLDDERRQFSQALGELQKKIDRSEKENGSQKVAVTALEKSLEEEKAKHAELVRQLAATEEKAAEKYADEKEKAQTKIETLKDKLDDERGRYKEAMAAEKKHADKIQEELKAQNNIIVRLDKAHSDGEAQIAAATRELSSLAQKKSEIALKERERAQHGIDAAMEKLNDERRQFNQTLGELQNKVDNVEKENGSQKAAVAALEKSLAVEKAQQAELVKQLATTEEKAAEKYANEKQKAQTQIDMLKDNLKQEQYRSNGVATDNRKQFEKIELTNAKLEQSKKDLADAKVQEKLFAQQLERLKDELTDRQNILADTRAAKQQVDNELKKTAATMQDIEKSGVEARAEVKSGKVQLNTLERALDKANGVLDELNRKLNEREKVVELRTRERDQYDIQSKGLKDQLGELNAQIRELTKLNENLHKDSKQSELSWQEKIIRQTTIETNLRAHIKKLEALVSKELRNARHGIMNRIDDMEAVLDIESQRTGALYNKDQEKFVSLVDRKAS